MGRALLMHPVSIPSNITMIVDSSLDIDDVKRWYRCIREFGPQGITRQFADINNGIPTTSALISRKEKGVYTYIVPLTRDLLEREATKIVEAFSEIYSGDFEIQTSSKVAKVPEHETSVVVASEPFHELCDNWAKRRHHNWCNRMASLGWRCGEDYDLEAKIHPNLKPWEQLKTAEKDVDHSEPKSLIDLLFNHGYAITKI